MKSSCSGHLSFVHRPLSCSSYHGTWLKQLGSGHDVGRRHTSCSWHPTFAGLVQAQSENGIAVILLMSGVQIRP
jgi:hypothetical protein